MRSKKYELRLKKWVAALAVFLLLPFTFCLSQDGYVPRPGLGVIKDQGGQVYNVKASPFNAKGDGTTDDYAGVVAAMNAASAAGGGVVYFPPGTYVLNTNSSIFPPSNIEFRGCGRGITTIKHGAGWTGIMFNTLSTGTHTVKWRDMTIDGGGQSITTTSATISITARQWRSEIENVSFVNIPKCAVLLDGAHDVKLTDVAHTDPGTARSTFVQIQNIVDNVWITRCSSRYGLNGVIHADSKSASNVHVTGCYFEGNARWLIASYTNSGGTVTYDATHLTDSAASFNLNANRDSSMVDVYGQVIRIMNTRVTGASGTYSQNKVTDAGATFVSSGVQEHDVVRAGGAFAEVIKVVSETEIDVRAWESDTDRTYVTTPAANASYKVYNAYYGLAVSWTSTAITVTRWFDVNGATISAPTNGTLYEVAYSLPNYQGVKAGLNSRSWSVTDCEFAGTASDSIAFNGGDYHSAIGNNIHDGRDVGITVTANHSRIIGNYIDRIGAVGIALDAANDATLCNHNIVSDNVITRQQIVNNATAFGAGIQFERGAANNTANNNTIDGFSLNSWQCAISLYSSGAPNIDSNVITGTRSFRNTRGAIEISGATVTNTRTFNRDATVSLNTGTSTNTQGNVSFSDPTVVTVNANSTGAQNLNTWTPTTAGLFNVANRTFHFHASGVQTVNNTAFTTFKVTLNGTQILSAGNGTVTATLSNLQWVIDGYFTVVAAGSSGTVVSHGTVTARTTSSFTGSVQTDGNSGTPISIDLTGTPALAVTVTFSANGSTANTCSQQQFTGEVTSF